MTRSIVSAAEARAIAAAAIASGALARPGQPLAPKPATKPAAAPSKPVVAPQSLGQPIPSTGSYRAEWVDVGPDLAKQLLEANVRNRSVSPDVVEAYARDMRNGAWILTHQGIALNDQGELIDGQHRLHAVVASGQTVRMCITYGLPSRLPGVAATAMDAVDRGRARSVGDQLKIQHGLAKGGDIAQICAQLAGLCCPMRIRRLSVPIVLQIYEYWREPIDWLVTLKPKTSQLRSKGVAAAFAFVSTTGEVPHWQTLYTDLVAAEWLPTRALPSSGIAALRQFLLSDAATLLARTAERGLAELALDALLLEQTRRLTRGLSLTQEGPNHYRPLQPPTWVPTIANTLRPPAK